MINTNMTKCKVCNEDIAKRTKKCIHCGKDQRNFFMRHKVLTGVLVVVIFAAIGGSSGDDEKVQVSSPKVETEDSVKVEKEEVKQVEIKQEEVKQEETKPVVVEEVVDSTPREHKAALKKGQIYADTMHMSKQGVYDQLVSEYGENFPEDAAKYAIDNVVADWKVNALEKAIMYADTMSMSNSAVYDQLISDYGEKFTAEEARYAVDNLD